MGFQGGTVIKNPPAAAGDARDLGLIPGQGRFPGGGNGNPLQYSCLENPMDGEAWQATVHGVAKSQTRLSDFTFTLLYLGTDHLNIYSSGWGFPGGSEVKASASNAGDLGSIPGLGRSPGEEMVTHSSILAQRIPWTEKPGRLQSMGSQRGGHD